MKQYFGMSQTGNLKEAAQGVHAPGLLILMSNADQFEAHVTELESLFPGVPSIGCIGMSYSTRVVEKGVDVYKRQALCSPQTPAGPPFSLP